MTELTTSAELLLLFKALADKNRLKIIGFLAQRPHAVEELSKSLKIGASTVSHHLSVLGRAGLVAGKVQGYYSIYSLQVSSQETRRRTRSIRRCLRPSARPKDGSRRFRCRRRSFSYCCGTF